MAQRFPAPLRQRQYVLLHRSINNFFGKRCRMKSEAMLGRRQRPTPENIEPVTVCSTSDGFELSPLCSYSSMSLISGRVRFLPIQNPLQRNHDSATIADARLDQTEAKPCWILSKKLQSESLVSSSFNRRSACLRSGKCVPLASTARSA